MTKQDIGTFLHKWKGTIVLGTLFTVAAVALVAYLRPAGYEASARVFVESTRSPIREDPVNVMRTSDTQNTEMQIITSRPVFATVVDSLQLVDRPTPQWRVAVRSTLTRLGLWTPLPPREGWIKVLAENVRVKPVVDSNVLEISYQDADPEWAAKIVNRVTEAYLTHRLNVYASRGASQFYKEQMDRAFARLQALRDELSETRRQTGVVASDVARRELVLGVNSLRDRLVGLETELSELLSRYDETHIRVTTQRQKIAGVQREISKIQEKLGAVDRAEASIRTLEGEIAAQEKAYESQRSRYEERRMMEAANVAATNVQIISPAVMPMAPMTHRLNTILIGLVGGFALALLIALIREYFDDRVTNPEQVEQILGIPVVGSFGQLRY